MILTDVFDAVGEPKVSVQLLDSMALSVTSNFF